MKEHRHIKKILLTANGALIIYFNDNSHTYIEPDIMEYIFTEYIKNKN